MKKTIHILVSIFICELAGIIGSIFTTSSIPTWYATIIRPDIAPPNWVFAPVWTTLFALMGIALFLIWSAYRNTTNVKIKKYAQYALTFFAIQLVLNVLWSIIFFGLHNPGLALVEIIFLWIFIFATLVTGSKISAWTAWLLAPYLLWVSFAGYLNYLIWILNY